MAHTRRSTGLTAMLLLGALGLAPGLSAPASAGSCASPRYSGDRYHGRPAYHQPAPRHRSGASFSISVSSGGYYGASYGGYYARSYCPPPTRYVSTYCAPTYVRSSYYCPPAPVVVRPVVVEREVIVAGPAWGASSGRADRAPASYSASSYDRRLGRAWDDLLDHDVRGAAERFDELVCADPKDAEARVGLAFCSSLLGDDEAALEHMRRAVSLGLDRVRLPRENETDDIVADLVDRYDRISEKRCDDADVFFMLAANAYFDGADRLARRSILEAQRLGDRSYSTQALARLVGADQSRGAYGRR